MWGKPTIKCRNQEQMSRKLHHFFPGHAHILQQGNQDQPSYEMFSCQAEFLLIMQGYFSYLIRARVPHTYLARNFQFTSKVPGRMRKGRWNDVVMLEDGVADQLAVPCPVFSLLLGCQSQHLKCSVSPSCFPILLPTKILDTHPTQKLVSQKHTYQNSAPWL